ncbi:hypothetical protein G6F46_012064 [Rhizopus delemar]|uniref:BAG domain-containing protein n=3 Tax=Rhizopus TaxID=4842 RepID=I1C9N9_RHIO9|nr:hypothetical protein RO3G_09879 [Rhizopus delemar RA 99-880]KAG1055357.1 hypothetical protein G6F43_002683 [Rhizopus delemar]KAG1534539.1 hypothetical protein G6F51_012039 [Rhizopus arrhizus]KAG1446027.1 hypothetical protein G6F55_011715 [Rhizopus delemar]KAG1488724.1 hypothetical protein G6F54_011919 [Rhizopus delemar]|eukprot:EIE85169.1 hypothetical protein RO3G_09879 [Rhizopus delemar RA 99-880]
MKLQVSGANIKDDTASLTSVGVCRNSVVTLNGEQVDETEVKQVASGNPEEYALVLRIAKIVDTLSVGTEQELAEFEKTIEKEKITNDEKKKLDDKRIYLSEKIMQCLINLDSVECPPDFETARQRRREGVRYSQKLLGRVDKAKAELAGK